MVGRRRIAGTALVTGPDGPATRAIVGALGRRGYEVTRREDPATLPARAADTFALVILVDVGWDEQPSFAHVKQYARLLSRGGGALLVVTHDDSVDDLAALVATGARDFMVWPRDRAALKARILALESTQRAMTAAQEAREQMDALLRAFPDTHLVLEPDGVVTDVARGPNGDSSDSVLGWIGRRVDEIFSIPGGHELLVAVRRASESGVYYYQALAITHLNPENVEGAEKAIARAMALTAKDPYIYLLAGKISLGRKDYSTAIRRLLVATQLQPRLIPAHYALRTAYKALGDEQKSAAELEEIKRIGAENAASDKSPFSVEEFLFTVRPPS